MIQHAIPFSSIGEAIRINARGFLRASLKVTADDDSSGAIEIRRGYTHSHTAAYETPEVVDITGETSIDLIIDDCPELVVVVTEAGVGTFDVEWVFDNPTDDDIVEAYASLGSIDTIVEIENKSDQFDKVTIFTARDGSNTTGVVQLRAAIDPIGAFTNLGAVDLDGEPTTFDIVPGSRLDLYTSTGNPGLGADFIVYRSSGAIKSGLKLPSNVALTDAANRFSEFQAFDDGLAVDLSVVNTKAKVKRLMDFPDAAGDLAVVLSTEFPNDHDHMVRSGNGYKSIPQAGTSFPSSPYDGQSFYRTDFDIPELFHWDDTRSKWLGELRIYQMSRNTTVTSGNLSLRHAGSVVMSGARGYLTPSALTIVGAELFSNSSFTGDLAYIDGGTFTATLLSISSSRSGSDHTLNQDVDGDPGWPHKWFQMRNISAGSLNNPVVNILARRHES